MAEIVVALPFHGQAERGVVVRQLVHRPAERKGRGELLFPVRLRVRLDVVVQRAQRCLQLLGRKAVGGAVLQKHVAIPVVVHHLAHPVGRVRRRGRDIRRAPIASHALFIAVYILFGNPLRLFRQESIQLPHLCNLRGDAASP